MNGYTTIKIEGKDIGLKFAFPCVKWFAEASTGKNKDAFFTEEVEIINDEATTRSMMTDYGFAKLLHCAYKNNCLLKEVDPQVVFEDFVNWVEGNNADEFSRVMTIYVDSSVSKKLIEGAEKKSQQQAGLISI